MSELTLIHHVPHEHERKDVAPPIVLRADRVTLAKRRWRGTAADGREFGFDLARPLRHGACFFAVGDERYVVEQEPEAVIEIPVSTPEQAAAIAWQIGNLHLGVQVLPQVLRVVDDPAAEQMLQRERISFLRREDVFQPLSGGGDHPHHHAHA